MNSNRFAALLIGIACVAPPQAWSPAQWADCAEFKVLAAMANAKTPSVLSRLRNGVRDSYRVKLAFAARWFELHSRDRRAALALLDLIPTDDKQQDAWLNLDTSTCPTTVRGEIAAVGMLAERLSRDITTAIILAPERMQRYVAYSFEAVVDPTSDYAMQMVRACKARNQEFRKTVEAMKPEDRQFFGRRIFAVESCTALAIPEGRDGSD
jgi:hypothetical protein